MNWRVSAEVFAVLASYLIITLPIIGATEINIYYNDAPSGSPINLDYSDIVKRDVSVNNPGGSASIALSATNATADNMVLEAYVYKCRGNSPTVCMIQVTPVTYGGDFTADYGWSDVRDTGTGYPQTANIMTFVKVERKGGVSWLGYWDVITRASETGFDVESKDIDEIEVHAKASQFIGPIIYFIENFFMIPMNTNWVSKVVFRTATEINELKSSEMPAAEAGVVSGDEITSIEELYHFIFPVGTAVLGSSTLNLNSDYICGAYGCEHELGEGQSNCCYDCGCPVGYYCDTEMVCKSESSISMSLHGSPDTRVTNCNENHVLYIPVKIQNLPSGTVVKSVIYNLGEVIETTTYTRNGDVFSCVVNVPAVEGCDTGEYWVGPNSIIMVIEYPNGESTNTKSMTVSFPDITIGSFECGNELCESTLGENQENCCLDCGCPAGEYCDWGGFGSVPSDAGCKDPLVSSDLFMGSINPSHFYDQPLLGNSPGIDIIIKNSPSNIVLNSLSCEMQCTTGSEDCQSTCILQSCATDTSVPGIFNRTCTLNFVISDYDPLTDYQLSPVFTADVTYSNGTGGSVDAILTSTFPIISIGAHWCGDYLCGSDESSYTCCYDCGCPEGQYCDTKNLNGPSADDVCRNQNFHLTIDDIGNTLFQDSAVQHYLDIAGSVSNYPSGTILCGSCKIHDGEFECSLICNRVESQVDTEYNFTCQMIIPPIDYIDSQYYDPGTRLITLTQNSYTITHVYNEGPDNMSEEYDFTVDEIKLNVTSHCGEGGCEANLDETQSNCCRDCGCSDYSDNYFCYTGQNPNGVCLPNSSILLEITGFEPDSVDCIIYREGTECIVTLNTLIDAHVVNPPGDIIILESYYVTGSQENDTIITCHKTLEDDYTCPIALENIPDASSEGTENISIDLKMTIEYTIDDVVVWQNIQGTSTISVNKKYSAALMSCNEMIAAIDRQITSLEMTKDSSNMWMSILLALGAIFLALFVACLLAEWWGGGAVCFTFLTLAMTCFTAALAMMNAITGIDAQIAALRMQKMQKMAMCDAQATADMAMAQYGGLTPIPPVYV